LALRICAMLTKYRPWCRPSWIHGHQDNPTGYAFCSFHAMRNAF
jgi:hypothetical protein